MSTPPVMAGWQWDTDQSTVVFYGAGCSFWLISAETLS